MRVLRATRWLLAALCTVTVIASVVTTGHSAAVAFAPHAVIAHAGDDQTVEGGATVSLNASASWDADGHVLNCTWTQVAGPAAALDLPASCQPTFTAPTPGANSVPAENQVVVYEVAVSDGSASSTAQVRVLVLKPFDPVADGPAVVRTTSMGGGAGTLWAALMRLTTHPGTRMTFDLPISDPGYNAVDGVWQFPHAGFLSIPLLQFVRGVTIDGSSQRVNAMARGDFVNPNGPAILIPGVIMEFGHSFAGGLAERTLVRGLIQEMAVWNGSDLVLSGNYYNVHPRGDASLRTAGEHVGFSTGGTTCGRLIIDGGANVRVGGATPEERNLIGSGCVPVRIAPGHPLTGMTFVGNYVGIDRTGTFSIDNGSPFGLTTQGHGSNAMDARIGGVTAGSGNVFSGITGGDGAQLRVSGENNRVVVQGNHFGLNAAGTAAIPNLQGAVFMTEFNHGSGPGALVAGGPQPGAGNVMSGNIQSGVLLHKLSGLWRIAIHGNRIGTAADGLSAIPNAVGIVNSASPGGVVIGGGNRGEGNVISGNTLSGIELEVVVAPESPVRVLGNLVGVGADGTTPVPNGGSGVVSKTRGGSGHQAHIVGGATPGERNVIAYNGLHGVSVSQPNRFGAIRGNSIHSNDALGITLQGDHVTTPLPNNPGDAASNANDGRNHPVLTSASISSGVLTITASIDTLPGLTVAVDYFANGAADPSGFGEGQRYLGSETFSIPATGSGPYIRIGQVPAGSVTTSDVITATMTDQYGNTSEFSGPVGVTGGDDTPPSVTCPASITVSAGAGGTAPIPDVLANVVASDNVTDASSIALAQTPAAGTPVGVGTHAIIVTATDAAGNVASCSTTVTVEAAPLDCSAAAPTVSEIWPPNHKWLVEVGVLGVVGSDGRAAMITIQGILQDEPTDTTGDGHTAIDGAGVGTATARLRAERTGSPRVPGNGRVYEILFTATSGASSCSGAVFVGVPHDRGKGPALDDGIRYDSTVAGGARVR